ncbi:MAG: hypothetical protein ACRDEA_00110 [Microcystaceae cyanobacterium]
MAFSRVMFELQKHQTSTTTTHLHTVRQFDDSLLWFVICDPDEVQSAINSDDNHIDSVLVSADLDKLPLSKKNEIRTKLKTQKTYTAASLITEERLLTVSDLPVKAEVDGA